MSLDSYLTKVQNTLKQPYAIAGNFQYFYEES